MPGFKIKEQEGYNLSTAEIETIEAIAVLGDPGADRILFWDESANTWKFLTVGTGLSITATTLTATGMSNPMTAIGDLIYGDTAGAIARLAGNTTTTKKFLTSVGDGTNSTAPAYSLDFSTDVTFAGNSDTIIPSQKAIKTYVDGSVAGLLDYRGGYDASGNTYPVAGGSGTAGAVLKGDMWIISVAGSLGGEAVQVGDSIIANVDTPAQTASNWNHLNANISYVPEDVANKKTDLTDNSDTYYPTQKAVKTAVDAKAPLTAPTFATSITGSYLTASEILITDASKNIVSAPVATYPSLTELSYIKGLSSAVQTQIGNKAPSANPTFTGTVTLPKTTKIQDTSADHTYNLAVSELTADRTVTLPLLTGDDTFLFKDFHKATSAEINTGTEDNKYITPKALEDSSYIKEVVEDTTPELGGELDCGAHSIGFTQQTATGDGTTTIDWKLGNKFKFTFGAQAETFTFTAPSNPCNLVLMMVQDGTGSRKATFPTTVKWAGGTAPTLTTAGNGVDIISFYYDGSYYHGVASLAFAVPA